MAHTLITGGARCGKSSLALKIASERYDHRAFIATAEPIDAEMDRRIHTHREERGSDFFTIEEPVDLLGAFARLPATTGVAVVDCLTVWLGNLFFRAGDDANAVRPAIDEFTSGIRAAPCDLILVTNEVGWGIVPDNRLGRDFRDMAGYLNRTVAADARSLILCVCGIPVTVKGEPIV